MVQKMIPSVLETNSVLGPSLHPQRGSQIKVLVSFHPVKLWEDPDYFRISWIHSYYLFCLSKSIWQVCKAPACYDRGKGLGEPRTGLYVSPSKALCCWPTGWNQPTDKFGLLHGTFFKILSHYSKMETFHIKSGFLTSLEKLEVLVTLDTHSGMTMTGGRQGAVAPWGRTRVL